MQLTQGITAAQRAFWEENGYLILPRHFSDAQVEALDDVTEWMWREKPRSVSVDNTVNGDKTRLASIRDDRSGNRLKLNDLYLLSQTVRSTVLERGIVAILADLLGDDPVLINTLTIDIGTEQSPHIDTMFMTPARSDALAATWMALEDVAPDCGPLFYYPGSHKIPAYHFSTSLQRLVSAEYPDWWMTMDREMQQRGIKRHVFLPKRGDVFIWHARLIHGGSPIANTDGTRKSLVSHFFSKWDCVYLDKPLVREGNAFWLDRNEQEASVYREIVLPDAPAPFAAASSQRICAGKATIDCVIPGDGGTPVPVDATVAIPRDQAFMLRGWAFDERARRPLSALGVELPDGTALTALYGMGRHDVAQAYSEPGFNDCGFLLRVPAGTLSPGEHELRLAGVAADGSTILDLMATVRIAVV